MQLQSICLLWVLSLGLEPVEAAVVRYKWDVRDWVVDFLRPTISTEALCVGRGPLCGSEVSPTARVLPFHIDQTKLKSAQLVNGMYPGPLIEANEGDTIEITVVNSLRASGTTIHWHGLHMRGTPWEDGPVQVSQAPIMPNSNYTYRFEAYPSGTFYWHSHMDALQQSRGVKGPIVIHPKQDPFEKMYTEEKVIMVSDEWRDPESCFKLDGAMPGNPVCSDAAYSSFNGQWGDGTDEYPYPLITVKQGRCYRLRWINSGGNAENFIISIAGHNMTMITVDGSPVKPVQVKSFNIHNGERTDVVVCMDQDPGYYLITAEYDYGCRMLKGKNFPIPGFHPVESCKWYAFLHYEGTMAPPPKAHRPFFPHFDVPVGTGGGAQPKPTTGAVFDTTVREGWGVTEPLNPLPLEKEPDLRYVVTLGLKGPTEVRPVDAASSRGRWFADVDSRRMTWSDPLTPTLHTKGRCGADKVPILNIPENVTTVELIINNLSPTEHVMHMHGGYFRVTNIAKFDWCTIDKPSCFLLPEETNPCPPEDRGFGDLNHTWLSVPDYQPHIGKQPLRLPWIKAPLYWGCKYNAAKDRQTENLKTPLVKDTMSVWQRSWAVIRFEATNPGMWLFHCHLQPHIPLGMMMLFNILPSKQPPIPEDVPTQGPCPVWSWAAKYEREAEELHKRAKNTYKQYHEGYKAFQKEG